MKGRAVSAKYAYAFYALFKKDYPLESVDRLTKMCAFFSQHQKALFLLGLPQLDNTIKEQALHKVTERIGIADSINKLFLLLVKHNRTMLIPEVCTQLRKLILKHYSLLECTVTSASELSDEEKKLLEDFFAQETQHTIKAHYTIDKALIAGVAFKSDTYVWEYSVQQQLHAINQSLMRYY